MSFERFLIPHTAHAAAEFLYRIINECNLKDLVQIYIELSTDVI